MTLALIGFSLLGFNGILVVAAIAGAALGGAYLLRKDTSVEQKRSHAIEVAQELHGEGMEHIPSILNAYAVGDYSGMVSQIKSASAYLRSDENRRAFLQKFLKTQLDRAMKDPERRQYVMQIVDDFRATEKVRQDELFAKMQSERAPQEPAAT